MSTDPHNRLIVPFSDVGTQDVATVGGKCSSLGELMKAGLPVPGGFAITTHAYQHFIEKAGLREPIVALLEGLDVHDIEQLADRASQIRTLILAAQLPDDLINQVTAAYRALGASEVSVRSSTSVEDGSEASFAGQQETFLYIHGTEAVLQAVLQCFASLWTDRAILYAKTRGFDHIEVFMAVGVQKMVSADKGMSGVMFTIDPDSGHTNVITIEALYGLGETIVSGGATPDGWIVGKNTLKTHRPIVKRTLGSKEITCVRDTVGTKKVAVSARDRARLCLSDDQVLQLARYGLRIEEHYGRPMDIEWAIDGDGAIWILQARPETVASNKGLMKTFSFVKEPNAEVIANGTAVGNMIASGTVYVLTEPDPAAMAAFPAGAILATEETTPSWLPAMRKAAGIITQRGGRTSHAAIVSREQGIPAVVGTGDSFDNLQNGDIVTVTCASGAGKVYRGEHPFVITEIDASSLPPTRTRIMLNLADPELALDRSQLPHQGVGLLRAELIIADIIGIHPMALLEYPDLDDRRVIAEIQSRTAGYETPARFFVEKLAEGIGLICAAFAPHPVIFRLSDFKTNEYRGLLGGEEFEGHEENPMLGFRGAGRYTDKRYKDAFALECEAVHIVRDVMGLTNLRVMVPFIRTPNQGLQVLDEMRKNRIPQGFNGLQVYAMIEVPSNVIRAKELAEIFDGFSIGSNDLTQLTLGIDRDSGDATLVATFDEMDPAVLWGMEQAILAAHAAKIPCGICGQGPSDRPELAAWLVGKRINSMSVLSDALLKTIETVAAVEEGRRVPA